jgi:hypothetical protein
VRDQTVDTKGKREEGQEGKREKEGNRYEQTNEKRADEI